MRKLIDASRQATIRLEIDGGVKVDNIGEIARAGADMFVAGSAIFGAKDYKAHDRRRCAHEIAAAQVAGSSAHGASS